MVHAVTCSIFNVINVEITTVKFSDTRAPIRPQVEQLEHQMREMTKLMEANEHRRQETETERKEAVEKIGVLRDIILDLELQVEVKTKAEAELKTIINELEEVIRQQGKVGDELSQQLESYRSGPDLHQLKERVVYLENESQQLRLNSELAGGDGILKDIQTQVCSDKYTVCV